MKDTLSEVVIEYFSVRVISQVKSKLEDVSLVVIVAFPLMLEVVVCEGSESWLESERVLVRTSILEEYRLL